MTASWPPELVAAGEEMSAWMGEKVSFLDTSLAFLPWHVGEVPAAVGALTELTKVSGQESPWLLLPEEVGQLGNLKQLDFVGVNLVRLPLGVGDCKELTALTASDAGLDSIPESIGGLSRLRTLRLSRNRIWRLPASLSELGKLETLEIADNRLGRVSDSVAAICGLHELRDLNLSGNRLRSLPRDFGRLGIERLALSLNYLNDAALDLPQGSLRSLTHLSMNYNHLTRVPDFVLGCANLESLSLEQNNISVLPDGLREFLPNLTELRMEGNPIPAFSDELTTLLKS